MLLGGVGRRGRAMECDGSSVVRAESQNRAAEL